MEKYELNLSERTSAGVTLVSVALLSGDITEHDLHGLRPLIYNLQSQSARGHRT